MCKICLLKLSFITCCKCPVHKNDLIDQSDKHSHIKAPNLCHYKMLFSWSETNELVLWRFYTGNWNRKGWIRSKKNKYLNIGWVKLAVSLSLISGSLSVMQLLYSGMKPLKHFCNFQAKQSDFTGKPMGFFRNNYKVMLSRIKLLEFKKTDIWRLYSNFTPYRKKQ